MLLQPGGACPGRVLGPRQGQGLRGASGPRESPAPPPDGFRVVSTLLAFPRRGLASGHSGHSGQQTQGRQDPLSVTSRC